MCGLCSTVMIEDLHQIPQRGQNVWRAIGCPRWGRRVTSIFMTFHLPGLDEVRHCVNRDGFLKDSGKWVTNFWHGSPRSVPSKNTNFLSDEFLLRQANKLQVWGGGGDSGQRCRPWLRFLTLLIVHTVCVCIYWPIASVTLRILCPLRERAPPQQHGGATDVVGCGVVQFLVSN